MRKLSSLLSVFLLIFGAVYFLQFSNSKGQQIGFDLPYSANAEETSENSGHIIEMMQGDQDAYVEMIEYASFTCPHCAKFHSDVYPELKANYIDKGLVKFIYREVYFDKYGMWASMIARCAGPEKFFGMPDQIYRKQSESRLSTTLLNIPRSILLTKPLFSESSYSSLDNHTSL